MTFIKTIVEVEVTGVLASETLIYCLYEQTTHPSSKNYCRNRVANVNVVGNDFNGMLLAPPHC